MAEASGETIRELADKIRTTNNPWEAEALAEKMRRRAKEQQSSSNRTDGRENGTTTANA
jgi:hypothetical protein